MNAFIYSREIYEESINEIRENETVDTTIQSTDDIYGYRTDNLVRKVWRVEIEYINDLYKEKDAYFVDCTTGEIIGGDSIR